MAGDVDDPLSMFEEILNRLADVEPLPGRVTPFARYEQQRLLERLFGYDQSSSSFTVRCPRCRNNSLYVDHCDRCHHIGIIGVVTVRPDRGYL